MLRGGGLISENCKKVHIVVKIPRVTITPLKKTHKTSPRDCSIVYDFDKLSHAAIIAISDSSYIYAMGSSFLM